MLQLLRDRHATRRKITLLDLEIGVEPGLMLCHEPADFLVQSVRAYHRLCPELDQQRPAGVPIRLRRRNPARQFGLARRQHLVQPAAPLPLLVVIARNNPACLRHTPEFAIDLLVTGMPEIAHRLVKALREVVAGGRLFQQRSNKGMLNRHGPYFNGLPQCCKTLCNQLHNKVGAAILYATSCVSIPLETRLYAQEHRCASTAGLSHR